MEYKIVWVEKFINGGHVNKTLKLMIENLKYIWKATFFFWSTTSGDKAIEIVEWLPLIR
jgi:hypothetical protein